MIAPHWLWIGFNAFVLMMLALDLGVFHRKAHTVSLREALSWTTVWIGLALLFNLAIWQRPQWFFSQAQMDAYVAHGKLAAGAGWQVFGNLKGLEFLTGYVVEKSLSVDNVFVFLMVFTYFRVPTTCQHKVLFWGVLGALVMRAIFIFAGVALIERFHAMVYVFGLFLVATGIKMWMAKGREIHPEQNPVIKLFRRFVPVTTDYSGDKFFVTVDGRRLATPLALVLVFIETSDLIFAVDSIPAILAITQDQFIVYTSNVFAILGLRSLYFALAGVMDRFHLLGYGLAVILGFVGGKMLLVDVVHVPVIWSLAVIAGILLVSVAASLVIPPNQKSSGAP
jgi:tellurite resistance protein TerC